MGEIARKTEHSTARGDVRIWQLGRAAILLPRREKMERISLQCANEQHRDGCNISAESLTEKRRTLVSQKLLKFFWTLTYSPRPGEYNVRFAIKALKSGKAGGVTALMLNFLYYYYLIHRTIANG